jgi:hypothetical protein
MQMTPSIGRIVHFTQKRPEDLGSALVHLPAIITAVWSDTRVNLQVFTDGGNSEEGYCWSNIKWVTSVTLDETAIQPRSWHWPETVVSPRAV